MQKVFINYKDIIDSYEAINKDFGLLPSGVYRGFDTIEKISTGVRLLHTTTGATYTNKNGTQVNNIAVIKTPQGAIITEDAPVELPISAQASSVRIDVVVIEHSRGDIQGGSVAIPSVIEGTPGAGIPLVTGLSTKVIIGYLRIEPNGNYYWTRATVPQLANFDLRSQSNKWSKQQTLSIQNTPLSITDNRVIIDNSANTFYINATSDALEDKQLFYLNERRVALNEEIIRGTEITLINNGAYTIQILNQASLAQLGVTNPPAGFSYIDIPTTLLSGIKLKPGGSIKLIEDKEYNQNRAVWRVVSILDDFSNPYSIAQDVETKDWGTDEAFVEAVKHVIGNNAIFTSRKTTALTVNSGGVIQNGAVDTHLNILNVDVPTGITEISSVQTDFNIGTRVSLLFNIIEPLVILKQSNGIKGFKSPIGFDYEIKSGSIIECIQLADGLHVISGTPYIKWETPAIQGVASYTNIGAFKYAIYPDGYIRFLGGFEVPINTFNIELFTLPKALFSSTRFQDFVWGNLVAIPSFAQLANEGNQLQCVVNSVNNLLEDVVRFKVGSTQAAKTNFNFTGIAIPYK